MATAEEYLRIMEAARTSKAVHSTKGPRERLDLVFVSLVAVGLAARLAAAWLLPPLLDVYYYDSQAVGALLHAQSPYGLLYAGVPSWLATPGAANVFAYLPAVPLFLLPFGAVWDVRLGLVAADLTVALSLAALGGRTAKRASLVFFLLPFDALFSTSYPNNTLVGMCFLGLAVLFEVRGRRTLSAASLGASLAGSQFVWLLYPLFARHYAALGWRREVAVSLATAAAIILPFLAWSPGAFLYDTVIFQFARPVQHLVTPMAFGFNFDPTLDGLSMTFLGVAAPVLLRASLFVAALALAVWRSRDAGSLMLNATWLLLLAVWLLPSDFSWWYLELPFQTLLVWLAIGRRGSPAAGRPNA